MTWFMVGAWILLSGNVWRFVLFERVLYHSSELLFLNVCTECPRRCSQQPAHEKIGVVDSQWIVHQVVPSLGNQVRRNIMFFSFFYFEYVNFGFLTIFLPS